VITIDADGDGDGHGDDDLCVVASTQEEGGEPVPVWVTHLTAALLSAQWQGSFIYGRTYPPPSSPLPVPVPRPPLIGSNLAAATAAAAATTATESPSAAAEAACLTSAYTLHMRALLQHALSSPHVAPLLLPSERTLAAAIIDLPPPAQLLLARLLARKGPWFRPARLHTYFEWAYRGRGMSAGVGAGAGDEDDAGEGAVDVGGDVAATTTSTASTTTVDTLAVVGAALRALLAAGAVEGFAGGGRRAAASTTPLLTDNAAALSVAECLLTKEELAAVLARLRATGGGVRPSLSSSPSPVTGGRATPAKTRQASTPSATATPSPSSPAPTLSRDDMVAVLRRTAARQRGVFGAELPIASAVADALQGGRGGATDLPPAVRIARPTSELMRRAHALYYLATATAHLSSGGGTGCWPVAPTADGVAELTPTRAAPPATASLPIDLCGDSDGDDVGGGAPSTTPTATPAPHRAAAAAARLPATAAGTPSKKAWATGSGSRYADPAAARDSYLAAAVAGAGGGGLAAMQSLPTGTGPSPGLMALFHKWDFGVGATNQATPAVRTRGDMVLLEATHALRAAVTATGALASPAVFADSENGAPLPLPRDSTPVHCYREGGVTASTQALPLPLADGAGSLPWLAGLDWLPYLPLLLAEAPTAADMRVWAASVLGARRDAAPWADAARAAVAGSRDGVRSAAAAAATAGGVLGAAALGAMVDAAGATVLAAVAAASPPPPLLPATTAVATALVAAPDAARLAWRVSLALALHDAGAAIAATGGAPPPLFTHAWLHQVTPGAMLSTLLWEAVDPLERGGAYALTLPLLAQLVAVPYTPHRAGRWWLRLSLNCAHLGLAADAASVTRAALAHPHVLGPERLALWTRHLRDTARATVVPATAAKRRHRGHRADEATPTHTVPAWPAALCVALLPGATDPDLPSLAVIQAAPSWHARSLGVDVFEQTPLNNATGSKSRFLAPIDPANDGDAPPSVADDAPVHTIPAAAPAGPEVVDLVWSQSQPPPPPPPPDAEEWEDVTDALLATCGVTFPRDAPWRMLTAPSGGSGGGGGGGGGGSRDDAAVAANVDEPGGTLRVGVEELALAYYHRAGGWRGVHAEGGPVYALFALLAWDVLFDSAAAADTFITHFQDAPLDLDSWGTFYRARAPAIAALVARYAAASPSALAAAVATAWRARHGRICRGMPWDAYPLPVLQLVAGGLGGCGVAGVIDALAWNHKQLTGGMPDLLLFRVHAARRHDGSFQPRKYSDGCGGLTRLAPLRMQVALVEVKGPRDVLSEKQHLWLHILLRAGIDARVCKIFEHVGGGGGSSGATSGAKRKRGGGVVVSDAAARDAAAAHARASIVLLTLPPLPPRAPATTTD